MYHKFGEARDAAYTINMKEIIVDCPHFLSAIERVVRCVPSLSFGFGFGFGFGWLFAFVCVFLRSKMGERAAIALSPHFVLDLTTNILCIMSCKQPSHPRLVRCDILSTSSRTLKTPKIIFGNNQTQCWPQKASFPRVASSGQHLRLRPVHRLPALSAAVLDMPLLLRFI